MMKLSKDFWLDNINQFHELQMGLKQRLSTKIKATIRLVLIWFGVVLFFIGAMFGFDLIGELLQDTARIVVEFVQEGMEVIYRRHFKLDLYHAQMATAYTGFVIILGVSYFVIRKFAEVFVSLRNSWWLGRERALVVKERYMESIKQFWFGLDLINRVFVSVGLVVVAIPVVSILCLCLGKIVAELV